MRRHKNTQMPALPSGVLIPRVAPPHPCIAHGCPLSGTWANKIYETPENPAPRYCFIHRELPANEWQRATAEINRVRDQLRPIPDDIEYRREMRKHVSAALSVASREPGSDL